MSTHEGYRVAYDYTVRFFPRFYTWTQFQINGENSKRQGAGQQNANRLTGPRGMGPEYKVVVAINDDTIYAEAFLDVSNGPVILTIPSYQNKYSVLQLDVYGNIFSTSLSSAAVSTVSSRSRRSSSRKPTRGCMISTSGASPVRSCTAAAARMIARTCIS